MKFQFALVIVISLVFSSCFKPKPLDEIQETFVLSDTMLHSIRLDTVKALQLKNELSLYGKISADFNKMIEVYPIVGGNVISVNVELGDYVQKGQLLATIRSTEVAGYEQEYLDAKADLITAKNNLKVAQELFQGKLNTERDVIEANAQVDKSQAQLNKIQEIYRIYNLKNGSKYEVRSPISGFVIQKDINQDMLLRSDRTDNIFDIAQIDEVWAIANVNESDINQVKLGYDANITTLSYPDKIFKGKVDKIFNIIDPETKAMKIKIILQNHEYLLKPEMRASINLHYLESDSMLAVPTKSIIFDKSKSFVMVYKDRTKVETRQITIYRQLDDVTYISSGVNKNEAVISKNQLLIYDALND